MTPPSVHLHLLQTPRLRLADGSTHLLQRKDAALLALLALDGPTAKARAASLLWPDATDEHARNNLRQRLFRLRRTAGSEVVLADNVLTLAPGVTHDLAGLQEHLAQSASAVGGELLGGLEFDDEHGLGEWVQLARENWRAARRDVLAEIASRLETQNRIAAALPYAERLVLEEPLLEHAHRRLMRLHYLRGDRSGALNAYDHLCATLRREQLSSPARETLELARLIDGSRPLPRAVPPPRPVAALRPPRLVGRDAEWRQIEQAWASGRVVLVFGEAGIGKSRLLSDFAAAAAVGDYLRIEARPGDARMPYAVLARLVRALLAERAPVVEPWVLQELARVAPELAPPPPTPLDPLRLQQATQVLLRAAWPAATGTLFIDDLHYADDATLELLPALMLDAASPRWLASLRANEVPGSLAPWLALQGARAPQRVVLGSLSAQAVHELVVSLEIPGLDNPAWALALYKHTGGNPMFVLETLMAALADGAQAPVLKAGEALPLPGNIGQLIERRLEQLSPPALKLARVAALAGQDFSIELAARVLGQHALDLAEPWRELAAAQVIRDAGFAHDLIFEATLRTVPKPIAEALHGAIARDLEERPGVSPERVAQHWFKARVWDAAAQRFMEAARSAFAASRYVESGDLFGRAAGAGERSGDAALRHRALQEQVACKIKQFDLVAAKAITLQLQTLARTEEETVWALDRLADISNIGRDDAVAETAAREMLELARGHDNRWMAFHATRKLALCLGHLGRFDEALALFDTHADWIAQNAHEWNVHVWHGDRAYLLERADRRRDAIAANDALVEIVRPFENWFGLYSALRNRSLALHALGHVKQALRDMDEALRISDRLGDALVIHNPRDATRRGALLLDAGRHAPALELLGAAMQALQRADSPFWLSYCQDQLALAYLALGQTARAQALVGADSPAEAIEAQATRRVVQARLHRFMQSAGMPAALSGTGVFDAPECPARWRLLAALERACHEPPGPAALEFAAVADEAQRRELHGIALHARLRAACLAVHCGKACTGVKQALLALREIHPAGIGLAEFFWLAHGALVQAGEDARADAALARARAQIVDIELPQVPEAFRDSFLQRNPVNRAVLAAAARVAGRSDDRQVLGA
jgi:DNA-binding SARP family transcriptional activator